MIHWTTYYEKRSVERSLARSTVARSRVYLARGPRLLRCGSRSRFSRTEANPRFRIPRCRISRRPSGPLSTPLSPFRDYLLPPETLDKQSTQNYATLRNRTTLETTGNVMGNRDIATRMNCTRLRRSSSISPCSKITIILLFSVYLSKWRPIQRFPFFLCAASCTACLRTRGQMQFFDRSFQRLLRSYGPKWQIKACFTRYKCMGAQFVAWEVIGARFLSRVCRFHSSDHCFRS